MNLDDKLDSWREATDALEPSDALMAKLQAVVEAPTPPAGPAATLGTAVKVLLVVVLAGAIGIAVLHRNEAGMSTPLSSTPTRADTVSSAPAPSAPASVDAGPGSANALEKDTRPRSRAPAQPARVDAGCGPERFGALVALKRGSELSDKELKLQLTTRPLTCLAQRHPLEALLFGRSAGAADPQATRFLTRLTLLCGPSNVSLYVLPWAQTPCDDSDWCTRAECELSDETCASTWATHRASTCTHRMGVRSALRFACARFLHGETTDAPVRALAADAWCLNAEALKERDLLRTLDAGMELP